MFSAYRDDQGTQIRPLSKKKSGVQHTFLPVLEVSQYSYDILQKALTIKKSDFQQTLYEIGDRILQKRLANKEYEECIGVIEQLIESKEKISLFQFLLFSVLFNFSSKDNMKSRVRTELEYISEMAEGLLQIMENIVQYSMLKKGIFSFRIHIDRMDNKKKYLEVSVVDYNINETIIDNFMTKRGVKEEKISKLVSKVTVKDFFREYSDNPEDISVRNAWAEYHNNYPKNCMGLPRLKDSVAYYNAYIFMKSFYSYEIENQKKYIFEKNYGTKDNKRLIKETRYYIPGTQYTIVYPLNPHIFSYNSDIFIHSIGNLQENDETFAEFFDYTSKPEIIQNLDDVITQIDDLYFADSKSGKDSCVKYWCEILNDLYNEIPNFNKCIFYFDMNELCIKSDYWTIETFCKGMLSSLFFSESKVHYLAFINCTHEFSHMFLETFLLQDEKENLMQIYLVGPKGDDEILIAGRDRNKIESNLLQFGFSRSIPRVVGNNITKYNTEMSLGEDKEKLMPFDVLIEDENGLSIFDKYIGTVADKELTDYNCAGYKISDTHMRLGSKVHLEAFYETAILLQKPRIAHRVAFQLLKHLFKKYKNDLWENNILFYGYASYSRAILESLVELATAIVEKRNKEVKKENKAIIELCWKFAVYQNDIILQKQSNRVSPVENIYFNDHSIKKSINDYKIVQIVPISSTLTTFRKMKTQLETEVDLLTDEQFIGNYTMFWVRDENGKENFPSKIEKTYWAEIIPGREIETELIKPNPVFFCVNKSLWHDPLKCELCYPPQVINEKPLIETDPTSTIPSLQLESNELNDNITNNVENNKEIKENDKRVINLKNALQYGHIYRDENHFQYYINTSNYFISERNDIKCWLQNLNNSKKDEVKNNLNIIVTPQHHTNVEFCHYVNNYYYDGIANIITLDAAKEFKSNVRAKYADVYQTIQQAESMGKSIRFIYVDDTIITGTTYKRINNLIHILLPPNQRRPIQIDKVFVLVNRMSIDSQNNYVTDPKNNFYSYVDLYISSIRNYGTSCILCGLERDANIFMRRASTKYISAYWDLKQYVYSPKPFNNSQQDDTNNLQKKGYYRLLCSHYMAHKFNKKKDEKEALNEISDLLLDLYNGKNPSPIYKEVFCKDKTSILHTVLAYLKILNRPFYTFGKDYKQYILDFMIILTELFLNPDFQGKIVKAVTSKKAAIISDKKTYLNDFNLQEKIVRLYRGIKDTIQEQKYDILAFVCDYLLEGLTDLRSNYIIRYSTLIHINKYLGNLLKEKVVKENAIEDFSCKYQILIHRLVNSSTDETKSLWLESLIVENHEYDSNSSNSIINEIEKELNNEYGKIVYNYFLKFWNDLYIENTRLYYDGTNKVVRLLQKKMDVCEDDTVSLVDELWSDYYIQNLVSLLKINSKKYLTNDIDDAKIKEHLVQMVDFLYCIKTTRNEKSEENRDIIRKYTKIRKKMESLLLNVERLTIVISGKIKPDATDYYDISDKNGHMLDSYIEHTLKSAEEDEYFKKRGFIINKDSIVIVFTDNYDYLSEHNILSYDVNDEDSMSIKENRISPVYIHIKLKDGVTVQEKLMNIRRILMFRNQLIRLFELDFNNNSIHVLAQQRIKAEQLARDKAGDHSSIIDIHAIEYTLQYIEKTQNNILGNHLQEVKSWFLLKSYVNMRIARIFRWLMDENHNRGNVYIIDNNTDYWHSAMKNLGESIFSTMLNENCRSFEFEQNTNNYTAANYFNVFDGMFNISYNFWGKKGTATTFQELEGPMKLLECVNFGKEFYRSEYLICIILDILFSALDNSRPWDILLENPMYEEAALSRYLYLIQHKEDKCTLDLYTENIDDEYSYLVFKNVKALNPTKEESSYKQQLEDAISLRNSSSGISLFTAKGYIENLWRNPVKHTVEFSYEKEGKQIFFVCKLPILRRRK